MELQYEADPRKAVIPDAISETFKVQISEASRCVSSRWYKKPESRKAADSRTRAPDLKEDICMYVYIYIYIYI